MTTTNIGEIREFPSPVGENDEVIVKYDESTDTVSMPLWYWKDIVEYVIEVEENIK